MINLIYTEILKIKRSQMFLISCIGAATAPFVIFIAYMNMKSKKPDVPILFHEVFAEVNLYTILLIGVPLYGIITAYIYNREYLENTLKNILMIPVSRIKFFIGKFTLLLIWIIILTLISWLLTLIFGLIGGFEGLTTNILLESLKQFLIGGIFLYFLSTPVIFLSIILKNYVSTIVFTLVITMINVLIVKSDYVVLYPWTAIHVITTNDFIPKYLPIYSYISVFLTSIICLVTSILYFKNEDIS